MRRSVAMVLGVLAPLSTGCESASFAPPPPPELASTAGPSLEPSVKVIEMVLRSEDTPARTTWAQVGRVDAGVSRVSFRSSAPGAGDPPDRQAELIRRAAARGASVVIVEAAPGARVAEALDELKAKGTSVILLARPLAGREKVFPLVAIPPLAESASLLVKAATEDAKAAKLPSDGTAAILVSRKPDAYTEERVAALKDALKDAGVAPPEVLAFDGTQADASKLLGERLESDPKLTLVFAEDNEALFGTLVVRERIKKERVIILAGYAELGGHLNEAVLDQTAAVADRNMSAMAHAAFRLAMQLASAQPVAERTEVPIPFHRHSSQVAPDPAPPPGLRKSEVEKAG